MLLIYTKGYYAVVAQDAAVPLPPRKAPAPPQKADELTDAEKIAGYDSGLQSLRKPVPTI